MVHSIQKWPANIVQVVKRSLNESLVDIQMSRTSFHSDLLFRFIQLVEIHLEKKNELQLYTSSKRNILYEINHNELISKAHFCSGNFDLNSGGNILLKM